MKLTEVKQNLFNVERKYYLAHCISSDYALGAGIALEFTRQFDMANKLKEVGTGISPDCILVDEVFNLVTKKRYFHKPTYESLKASLLLMREIVEANDIKYLAMPKIGCGLDKLNWEKVKKDIEEVFWYTDIEIIICVL